MNEEKILVKSVFDPSACHKYSLIWYIIFFVYGWLIGWIINISMGFLIGFISAIWAGGLFHCILYFISKNNEVILTDYAITGIYRRRFSINIPIDSVTSVSKGWIRSLCITCAGNKYHIPFVSNRELFCSKLNELLYKRTQQALKDVSPIVNLQLNYDEIAKLKQLLDNEIITQEEFEQKKKQLLGL